MSDYEFIYTDGRPNVPVEAEGRLLCVLRAHFGLPTNEKTIRRFNALAKTCSIRPVSQP